MSAASKKILMYSKATCPFCVAAKRLFAQKGLSYEEIEISGRPELAAEMRQRANGGHTVPQIFIGDTHVGGATDLFALDAKGQLDPLLSA
nr:glutaredoxin 3 [Oceanococcus sp. HetDA_MAG_MS8]